MSRFLLIRIIGVLGVLLVVGGYYLLWGTSQDAEFNVIIIRTRTGILMTIFGNVMILFYMFKR